jgi:hypothetical protein
MSQANNTRVWIDSMEVGWVLQIWLFSFHCLLPLFLSPLRVWMTTSANPWISSGCRKFLTNGGERRQRSDEIQYLLWHLQVMAWYLLWHLQVMAWYILIYDDIYHHAITPKLKILVSYTSMKRHLSQPERKNAISMSQALSRHFHSAPCFFSSSSPNSHPLMGSENIVTVNLRVYCTQ